MMTKAELQADLERLFEKLDVKQHRIECLEEMNLDLTARIVELAKAIAEPVFTIGKDIFKAPEVSDERQG